MVGLAVGGLRFEDWISGRKVLHLSYQMCLRQILGDKLALRIHVGIDSVIDPKLSLLDFNRHVMGCGAHPYGTPINLVIRFPDSKVMTPG